jgi:hypothetical protein
MNTIRPNSTHHVDVECLLPVGVADLERILRLEPAGVVDKNVNFARGGKNCLAAFRR